MATNPQARVLDLLKRFNDGKIVCIDKLIEEAENEKQGSVWFNDKKNEPMSRRNIDRDIKVIKEHFPNSFELIHGGKGEKSCFKAITKDVFNNFLDKDTLALMVQTFNIAQRNNLLESLDISESDKRIIDAKIKKSKDCYEFITKPYETKKSDVKLLQEIEKAINWKRYITVTYKVEDTLTEYVVKPYKIVFMNENFYLACENTSEEFLFTKFRLVNIEKIELKTKTFHINPDIADFIKNMQTAWSEYIPEFRKHSIEVVVIIDSIKARFFKAKKHLPSQKVEETKDDGSIVVSFKVTQEMEVEELIKKWIPHMKVVSPLSLQQKIQDDLTRYLNI
jgi:predicted DNA-binding transcriptional regulator YafY